MKIKTLRRLLTGDANNEYLFQLVYCISGSISVSFSKNVLGIVRCFFVFLLLLVRRNQNLIIVQPPVVVVSIIWVSAIDQNNFRFLF